MSDAPDDRPDIYAVPEVDEVLDEAIGLVEASRPLPMSTTVKVNRDELLALLEEARDRLPEELRNARWLLRQRDDFLAQAQQDRDDIIEEGRSQVARMVERQEIVKAAEAKARQILADAQAEARTLRNQTDDFCDQRLAQFEVVLDRTAKTVAEGRAKLAGRATPAPPGPDDEALDENGFFDQDAG